MSKVIGFLVGAALVVVGVLTGNVTLIITGGAMIVSNAAMLLTMPKSPARQAQEMRLQLGEQPRSGVFGEAFVAGSLVDGFNYGGDYGTDWECLLIRLADHKCEGLTGFYVNDEYVEYTGNGNYPQFDDHHFELYFRADTSTEALPAVLLANAPGWTATDTGESGCDVLVCYYFDPPDAKKPAWAGGRPRFGFIVKGKKCYDPRLDDTVGGTGAHRWDDPDTWEWSENAAVCRYNWVRGIYANDQVDDPTQLLIGRGLSALEAPPENIFAAANLCDEVIDGEARYRVAGPVYSNEEFLQVEEMFAAATGGSVVTREGSVELEPGASKSVVATFTDDDLLSGSDVSWNQGILSESSAEWINTVIARYVEPTQLWRDHAAPVVRDTGTILADGKPREAGITLRLVRWQAQALRIAEITRRLGRLWGRATVTLGPRFCEIEDGDWVQWTSARRFGGATKTFRVEAYAINEKWHNRLTLREMNADVYGTASFPPDLSEVNPTTPPADPNPPTSGMGGWTLTATTLSSSGADIPALVISGSSGSGGTVDTIIFEYWKDDGIIDPTTDPDDPPWSIAATRAASATTINVEITSIVGGEDYYAAVTYVSGGFYSDRLILGPVTAGELDVSGQVQPLIDAAVIGLLDYKGNQDCSANPNYPSALKGDVYKVSVAGKIGGASGIVVDVGDLIIATADNAGGTQASVGSSWTTNDAGLTVQDEGSDLATGVKAINITGAGATASASGGVVTINIPGGGVGGGGDLTFIERVAVSAVSTVDIDLPDGYDSFYVELYVAPSSDGIGITAEVTDDGFTSVETGATDYHYTQHRHSASSAAVQSSNGAASFPFLVASSLGNAANEYTAGTIEVLHAKETSPTFIRTDVNYVTAAGAFGASKNVAGFKPTQSLNGIRLTPSAGTLTGFYKVWGRTA